MEHHIFLKFSIDIIEHAASNIVKNVKFSFPNPKNVAPIEHLESLDADIIKYPHVNNQYYDFLNYRETHFNLYAVQALMARVYWMKGDMTNAGNYAEKVINSGKFPLVDETEVKDYLAGTLSPKETIFGLYSTSYVETCSSYLYNLISFHSYQHETPSALECCL